MPPARPKPSEVAAEAKRIYHPYIERQMGDCPIHSYIHPDSTALPVAHEKRKPQQRLRCAVIDGDPVDVALDWYQYNYKDPARRHAALRIPVVNMANEKRAGGDWESGLMAPEECFARRSNLVHALVTPLNSYSPPTVAHYPIPQRGGLYSPSVGMCSLAWIHGILAHHVTVVYRDGPDYYQVWQEFQSLPVISVAPVRRPKLNESGNDYSFAQEQELMMEKMRTVLRIAAWGNHRDLTLGAFGCGPAFRNPVIKVAMMWKSLLFDEPEFQGAFDNVVFAIESDQPGNQRGGTSEFETFKEMFDPSNIFRTAYR